MEGVGRGECVREMGGDAREFLRESQVVREMRGGSHTCHRDGKCVDRSDNARGTGVVASKYDVLA